MYSVPITTKVVSSNPARGEVYSIQHCVIKFVMIWGRSVVFSGAAISSTNKTDLHHITEILLKVALKHHNPNLFCLMLMKLRTFYLEQNERHFYQTSLIVLIAQSGTNNRRTAIQDHSYSLILHTSFF
jgi:hypothetical protein